ncbi:RNA-guided endonuclease TnpB family protein [Actinokineospora xionganensis]|uniref:RNA-guided endonuclease TnpB family protein n=1 Tax=Actinokineospora xionganensis TaxID=2684470 RepID=UPI0028A957D9|nr:RNA-guided endonuclease TnpB family protein [Actinokineospora xionganensis]
METLMCPGFCGVGLLDFMLTSPRGDQHEVQYPDSAKPRAHHSLHQTRCLTRWDIARQAVARIHARVANLRMDSIHKLTTTLADGYRTVVVEDLNIVGMLGNRPLASHIADASFGEFRRQLDYKTRWNGGNLVVADRWFPSSQTCSSCGLVKPKLGLAVRTFKCERCGLVADRDHNAAINLKHYVDLEWPGDAKTGRGADQKTGTGPAGGCETPIPHHADGARREPPAGNGRLRVSDVSMLAQSHR